MQTFNELTIKRILNTLETHPELLEDDILTDFERGVKATCLYLNRLSKIQDENIKVLSSELDEANTKLGF